MFSVRFCEKENKGDKTAKSMQKECPILWPGLLDEKCQKNKGEDINTDDRFQKNSDIFDSQDGFTIKTRNSKICSKSSVSFPLFCNYHSVFTVQLK